MTASPKSARSTTSAAAVVRAALIHADDGLSWDIELAPYDLAAVAFSEPDVKLLQPQASLPGDVAESIGQRIRQLGARAVALRNPPLMKVLENPGFQSKPSEADPVPGWAVSKRLGVSITTDTTQGHAADPDLGARAAAVGEDFQRRADRLPGEPALRAAQHGPDYDVGLAAGGRSLRTSPTCGWPWKAS